MAMTALLKELIGGRKSRKVHHSSKTHFKKHRKTRRNKNTRKKHAGLFQGLKKTLNNATKAITTDPRSAFSNAKDAVTGKIRAPSQASDIRIPTARGHGENASVPANATDFARVGGKKTRRKTRRKRRKNRRK